MRIKQHAFFDINLKSKMKKAIFIQPAPNSRNKKHILIRNNVKYF